jgi:hypothetical protein
LPEGFVGPDERHHQRVNCWTIAEQVGEAAPWGCGGRRSWTSDPARCLAAGVPEGKAFATKPALAKDGFAAVFLSHSRG